MPSPRPLLASCALPSLFFLLFSCNRGASQGAAGAGSSPTPAPTSTSTPQPGGSTTSSVPTSAPCDTLTRTKCLASSHCTLHWMASSRYECRASTGPCEQGLRQSDRRACEARAGCVFDPGSCYCPFPGYGQTQVPDDTTTGRGSACACGGGPPARCKVSDAPLE